MPLEINSFPVPDALTKEIIIIIKLINKTLATEEDVVNFVQNTLITLEKDGRRAVETSGKIKL